MKGKVYYKRMPDIEGLVEFREEDSVHYTPEDMARMGYLKELRDDKRNRRMFSDLSEEEQKMFTECGLKDAILEGERNQLK